MVVSRRGGASSGQPSESHEGISSTTTSSLTKKTSEEFSRKEGSRKEGVELQFNRWYPAYCVVLGSALVFLLALSAHLSLPAPLGPHVIQSAFSEGRVRQLVSELSFSSSSHNQQAGSWINEVATPQRLLQFLHTDILKDSSLNVLANFTYALFVDPTDTSVPPPSCLCDIRPSSLSQAVASLRPLPDFGRFEDRHIKELLQTGVQQSEGVLPCRRSAAFVACQQHRSSHSTAATEGPSGIHEVHRHVLRRETSFGDVVVPQRLKPMFDRLVYFDTTYYANFEGSFFLNRSGGFGMAYSGLGNVAARAAPAFLPHSSPEGGILPALMLASHYDGFPQSPAAADALSCVGIALEALRNFLYGSELWFPVIINLNGAEETSLHAAHGFSSAHPWARQVSVVMNLEAAGTGGREHLFQTTSRGGRLLEIYRRAAPRPHGNSISQDLFEAKLIPGDTDFRIFRDYLGVQGIDFAIASLGYYYHTVLDKLEMIPPGVIQRYGETITAVAQAASRDMLDLHLSGSSTEPPEESNPDGSSTPSAVSSFYASSSRYYYFDILGFWFVLLPVSWFPYIVISLFGLWLCVMRLDRSLLQFSPSLLLLVASLVVVVLQVLAACGACALIAGVLNASGMALRWFNNMWLAGLVYAGASLTSSYFIQLHLLSHLVSWLSPATSAEHAAEAVVFHGGILTWTSLMAASWIYGLSVTYVSLLWIAGAILGRLVGQLVLVQLLPRVRLWSIKNSDVAERSFCNVVLATTETVGLLLPRVATTSMLVELVDALLPSMGRTSAVSLSSECSIALLFGVPAALAYILAMSPLQFIEREARRKHHASYVGLLAASALFGLLWCRDPFTPSAPKRLDFTHFATHIRDSQGAITATRSGVWVRCMDYLCLSDGGIHEAAGSVTMPGGSDDIVPLTSSLVTRLDRCMALGKEGSLTAETSLRRDAFDGFSSFSSWPFQRPLVPINRELTWYPTAPPLGPPSAPAVALRRGRWDGINAGEGGTEEQRLTVSAESVFKSIPIAFGATPGLNETRVLWDVEYHRVSNSRRVFLSVSGGPRITILFSHENVVGWSFTKDLPAPRKSCDCYWVYYAGGRGHKRLNFWVDIKNTDEWSFSTSTTYYDVITPQLRAIRGGDFLDDSVAPVLSVAETNVWRLPIKMT
eukprot:GHVS01036590.1.p1 GENE.GHVS01036590.1~~GHVS01036590.1.p1  ORF type:complete len:1156 (+),score=160.95 GHVS01036590.1:171-3638(+)